MTKSSWKQRKQTLARVISEGDLFINVKQRKQTLVRVDQSETDKHTNGSPNAWKTVTNKNLKKNDCKYSKTRSKHIKDLKECYLLGQNTTWEFSG